MADNRDGRRRREKSQLTRKNDRGLLVCERKRGEIKVQIGEREIVRQCRRYF
jgi:hypothetical protein